MACRYDPLPWEINEDHKRRQFELDRLTAMLCAACEALNKKKVPLPKTVINSPISNKDVELSLQTWWEGHQEKDKLRKKAQDEKKAKEQQRQAALAKLSKEEKKLLGLNDGINNG